MNQEDQVPGIGTTVVVSEFPWHWGCVTTENKLCVINPNIPNALIIDFGKLEHFACHELELRIKP